MSLARQPCWLVAGIVSSYTPRAWLRDKEMLDTPGSVWCSAIHTEYIRNSVLDAVNYFDLLAKTSFKRNQFGTSLGGPIKKSTHSGTFNPLFPAFQVIHMFAEHDINSPLAWPDLTVARGNLSTNIFSPGSTNPAWGDCRLLPALARESTVQNPWVGTNANQESSFSPILTAP